MLSPDATVGEGVVPSSATRSAFVEGLVVGIITTMVEGIIEGFAEGNSVILIGIGAGEFVTPLDIEGISVGRDVGSWLGMDPPASQYRPIQQRVAVSPLRASKHAAVAKASSV